jgi:trimethylamine---corrinoid protein Co-methyltransferase
MENLRPYTVLDGSEIDRIHENSLEILAETGISMQCDKMLSLLRKAGLPVDMEKRLVRFPRGVIEAAVKSAPGTIELFDRTGRVAAHLGNGEKYTACGHDAIYMLDFGRDERREATKRDQAECTRVADYYDSIDIVGVEVMPQDVPKDATLLHALDAAFNNTTKHIYCAPDSTKTARAAFEIARTASGAENPETRPPVSSQVSPTSPLNWDRGTAEAVLETVRSGIVLSIVSEPLSGVTAPYTLAGLLTVHNAETLSGIAMSQLIREGSPVIYGSAWATFDMKKSNVTIGSPEAVLLRIAGAQLARYYGIPYHTIAPDSDTHLPDEQLAWEKMASVFSAYIAGADLMVNGGMFSTGLCASLEQIVLDAEMFAYCKRIGRGIMVNEKSLALETITRVGHKGEYMAEENTLTSLGSGEHWEPTVSNRAVYENWKNGGKNSVLERAGQEVRSILKKHTPPELDSNRQREIARIIAAFSG